MKFELHYEIGGESGSTIIEGETLEECRKKGRDYVDSRHKDGIHSWWSERMA